MNQFFLFFERLWLFWQGRLAAPPKTVQRRTWQLWSSHLQRRVRIDLYLPPAYFNASPKQPFPVVYFNDGQDMQAVHLVPTLHRLLQTQQILSPLVVAIHADQHRMQEYGTIGQPDYKNRGHKATAYSKFLLEEFLPPFRQLFRISADPKQHIIAGFSLGGLSALDLAWNYPGIFGKVGVFSGSLWWRSTPFNPADPDGDRIIHERILQENTVKPLEFWLQTGTHDETSDRNKNGIIDAIDDTLDLIKVLKKVGFAETKITYVEVEKGEHHPGTWGQILPEFLVWALGQDAPSSISAD